LSSFAVRAASLTVIVLLLPGLGKAVHAAFGAAVRKAIAEPERVAPSSVVTDTAMFVGPLLLAGAAAALAAGMAQTGLLFARRRPASIAARLFDPMRAYDVARAALILTAIGFAACRVVAQELPALAHAMGKSSALVEAAGRMTLSVAWPALAVIAVLAATDVVVRRAVWMNRLRPSPEEAKRERRESEGDPEVRRARRRAHEAVVRGE
jgi:flagellar biosynthesis protein FlhB